MAKVISDEQRRLNKELHKDNVNFGNRAFGAGVATNLPKALQRMHELGICTNFLDYGTGKGLLTERLKKEVSNIQITGYDPSVDKYSYHPTEPFDIVASLDVLEHVEMTSIDAVIDDIKSLTRGFNYIVIDLQNAVKTLQDGRNAHILLAPCDWWINKFSQKFSSVAAFPIMHKAGIPQKIVIASTNNLKLTKYMYMFLLKMNVFEVELVGGVLGNGNNRKS